MFQSTPLISAIVLSQLIFHTTICLIFHRVFFVEAYRQWSKFSSSSGLLLERFHGFESNNFLVPTTYAVCLFFSKFCCIFCGNASIAHPRLWSFLPIYLFNFPNFYNIPRPSSHTNLFLLFPVMFHLWSTTEPGNWHTSYLLPIVRWEPCYLRQCYSLVLQL